MTGYWMTTAWIQSPQCLKERYGWGIHSSEVLLPKKDFKKCGFTRHTTVPSNEDTTFKSLPSFSLYFVTGFLYILEFTLSLYLGK